MCRNQKLPAVLYVPCAASRSFLDWWDGPQVPQHGGRPSSALLETRSGQRDGDSQVPWWQSWSPRMMTRFSAGMPGEPRLIILHKLQWKGHDFCDYKSNPKVKRCSKQCQETQNWEAPPPQSGCLYGLLWVSQAAASAGKGISCRDQHWELGWITASLSARYLCYALFIVMR